MDKLIVRQQNTLVQKKKMSNYHNKSLWLLLNCNEPLVLARNVILMPWSRPCFRARVGISQGHSNPFSYPAMENSKSVLSFLGSLFSRIISLFYPALKSIELLLDSLITFEDTTHHLTLLTSMKRLFGGQPSGKCKGQCAFPVKERLVYKKYQDLS